MSNTPNLRFRRKRVIETFKGRKSSGGCMRPGTGHPKEDMLEWHQERVRQRIGRRNRRNGEAYGESRVAPLRSNPGQLLLSLSNYSRNPKGEKRTEMPRMAIWPEGKTMGAHNRCLPGRMR